MKKEYFIDVVPLTPLPRGAPQYLTYLATESPIIGQMVSVPLHKRTVPGVIIEIKTTTNIKYVKPIKSIITNEAIITSEQLMLAVRISSYYAAPLSLVVKTILPLKLAGVKKQPQIFIEEKKSVHRQKKQLKTQFILSSYNIDEELTFIAEHLLNIEKLNGQALILTPTILQQDYVFNTLKTKFKLNTIAINSKLSPAIFRDLYLRVLAGEPVAVVALRNGILLPFQKLMLTVFMNAHHDGYKQWDQKPYYHAEDLIKLASQVYKNMRLIKTVSSPGIADLMEQREKIISEALPMRWRFLKKIRAVYRYNENQTDFLESVIKETLLRNGKKAVVAFILNRLGTHRIMQCSDCGWEARCTTCDRLLIVNANLLCTTCGKIEEIPPFCPKCHGPKLKGLGIGILKLKTIVERLNANNFRIITEPAFITPGVQEKTIVIMSDSLLSAPYLPLFNEVVIVNADIDARLPHWNSGERFIERLFDYVRRLKPKGILTLTAHTHESLEGFKTQKEIEKFFEKELNLRKAYNYPPFASLIVVTLKIKKGAPTAEELIEKISLAIKKQDEHPVISFKNDAKIAKIILKINPDKHENILKEIAAVIPRDSRIDVRPLTLD